MKTVKCKFCKHERKVYTGKEILFIRKLKKLTLKQFAEIVEASVSMVADCEKDRRNLSSEMTKKIMNYIKLATERGV